MSRKTTYSEICFEVVGISGIKCKSRRRYYVEILRRKTTFDLKMKETRNVLCKKHGDYFVFLFCGATAPSMRGLLIIEDSLSHSHTHTPHSVGLYLNELSGRRRDLYLTIRNIPKRQISMHGQDSNPLPSKRAIADSRLIDRAATGIGSDDNVYYMFNISCFVWMTIWEKQ